DVRVHVQRVRRDATEPPHQPADEPPTDIGTGEVVARVRQRLENVGAYWRLAGAAPDHGEELGQLPQVFQLAELAYVGAHARPQRRPATSDPLCTRSATAIADPNATAIPDRKSTRLNSSHV